MWFACRSGVAVLWWRELCLTAAGQRGQEQEGAFEGCIEAGAGGSLFWQAVSCVIALGRCRSRCAAGAWALAAAEPLWRNNVLIWHSCDALPEEAWTAAG